MTHPAVGALPRTTPIILPIASLEQHGGHLPLFTDSLLVTEVARRAEAALGDRALFAPVLWLGSSDHHLAFSGTLSASPRTYLDMLAGLIDSVVRHGFQRVLLLNGHGGNTVPCQQALAEARGRHPRAPNLLLATPYWALGARPEKLDPRIRQTGMGHACEWETSMMLRVAPQLVGDHQNAPPVALEDDPFAPAARAWNTEERSAPGHVGDPRDADAEKGEVLLGAFTDDVVRFIGRMSAWNGATWSTTQR